MPVYVCFLLGDGLGIQASSIIELCHLEHVAKEGSRMMEKAQLL